MNRFVQTLSSLRLDKSRILLIFVLLLAFFLRSYGRNWDELGHYHPDERMLIMVADGVHIPDRLYPDFFNYGSLPIYLLKGSSQLLDYIFYKGIPYVATYDGMLMWGRTLSTLFDLGTTLLVYAIATLLSKRKYIGLLASACYAIAFFPIQNSHFFVVDVYLTFFSTALLYFLIRFVLWKTYRDLGLVATAFGAALATKFTALLLIPGVFLVIAFVILRSTHKTTSRKLKAMAIRLVFTSLVGILVFFVSMPYAILPPSGILTARVTPATTPSTSRHQGFSDLLTFFSPDIFPQTRFLRDIKEQTRMNRNAYVFPYTLQYVTTLPYLYYLEQVVKWGMGPFLSLLAGIGVFFFIQLLIRNRAQSHTLLPLFAGIALYGLHVLVVGASAVKFMRYMLPLYPPLAISAGYGIYRLLILCRRSSPSQSMGLVVARVCTITIVFGALLLTSAFMNIYAARHTRLVATDWILKNIPAGRTLATEHWDDRVPVRGGEIYQYEEMTLYDQPDDERKWGLLNEKLKRTDYIILASNRLYTPLPKLADCTKYMFCFPRTATYYKKLFSGELGFEKVAEFTAYPHLGPITLNDDSADESFTVYEHPKIIIFKKR